MLWRYPEAMNLLDDKKISTPKKWVKVIKGWIANNLSSSETDEPVNIVNTH